MADVADRWTRIQSLFESALERPEDERTAWLRAACGHDLELYREIESLLQGDAEQHSLFGGRAADLLSASDLEKAFSPSQTGERVGPWQLGERIGTGGMGAVYRAERASGDFEQTAALKLIKPGMDSEAVVARFEAERQILARLQHPGIARLLGGGLTDAGRPYFAMEYVDGEPITDYADARDLGIEARLRLFVDVCEAVRYAHQSLVVHRDLKPSNILVEKGMRDGRGMRDTAGTTPGVASTPGTSGGRDDRSDDAKAPHPSSSRIPHPSSPRVKLLDFGIARLLEDDGDALLTRTGHRVLTPTYAAPEQIRGEAPTTATDVYALGGLLYRLLCGVRPLGAPEAPPREVEQAVLNDTPPPPSARISPEAAGARGTSETALARRLRGDLDTICLVALRKEPERRYGSAGEMLADVQRYLDGLPIQARPASRGYRMRKFVARHRAGVAGTAAAVVALVALTGFYTSRLAGERDRVEAEARRSEEVVTFLKDLLLGASPYEAPGEELTARELVDRGAARVDTALADEPATQATIQSLIAEVYMDLGRPEDAVPLYRRAFATLTAEGLAPEAATTQRELGRALREVEQTEDAEYHLRASLAALQSIPTTAPTEIALTERHLGSLLRDKGEYEDAEALYRSALATARRDRGFADPLTTDIANSLVILLRATDRESEAADLMADVVEADRRTFAPNHPDLGVSLSTYASLLSRAERGPEALKVAREALAIFRAAHPDTTHPDIAGGVQGVALALWADGQLTAADRTYADAIARFKASRGIRDPRTLAAINGYGDIKEELGDLAAAADLYLEGAQAAGDIPRYAGVLWQKLAEVRARQGRWRDARGAFQRSAAAFQEAEQPERVTEVHEAWQEAARAAGRPGEGPPRSDRPT
ncbi:MAG: tetratricopeptide repeat protein [Bacteroidota bacterium]